MTTEQKAELFRLIDEHVGAHYVYTLLADGGWDCDDEGLDHANAWNALKDFINEL
ncbi:hypothetical protein pzkkv8_235 [Klebsiella phage pzk-kv8]|nr:hypothetical protein pzkkv8_235 [Klebsiella phage pzk-kv8]